MKKRYDVIGFAALFLSCLGCSDDVVSEGNNECECLDTQTCINYVCVDNDNICGDIICKDAQTCVDGICVDNDNICGDITCKDAQTCVDGICVDNDNICGDITCKDAQTCVDGICVDNDSICGNLICKDAQTCVDGICVDNDSICGNLICENTQICISGQCVNPEQLCGVDDVCSLDQTCFEDECIAIELICGNTICTDEQLCIEGVCQDPLPEEILLSVEGIPVVSETGTSVTLHISLATQPAADVFVSVVSSDTGEVTVSSDVLTFTPDNWQTAQSVILTGVDDHLIDGDVKADISFAGTSTDSNYDGLVNQISLTNEDDDVAALIVSSNGASLHEASSDSAEFTVALTAQPTAEVTVDLTSSDLTELLVDGAKSIVFTPDNWNIPQSVKVKPEDDLVSDGTQSANIMLKTSSLDTNFNLLEASTELYLVTDNELVGLVITPSSTTLSPDSNLITLEVSLTTEPISDVNVTLSTTNDTTAFPEQKTFVFSPSNWNTPQTVTVSCKDFMSATNVITTEQLSAIASGEAGYANLMSNVVDLKIYAMTTLDFVRGKTCEAQAVTLLPGTYKLETWGAQGGSDGPGGGQATKAGGKGGYASGTVTLNETQTIYVMIGEYSPSFNTHGVYSACNGGGTSSGSGTGAGGGGATHFASNNRGELVNYASAQSEIYLVAGGGGGAADFAEGGSGGGETGGKGNGSKAGTGGTQTSGYKFGVGEPANVQNPAGGGGWYGGKRSTGGTNSGGGGGSGYIGGVLNGSMENGIREGDGKAKITVIEP